MLETCYQYERIEAGCDEAGRGCLAGAVFAAAVILPPDFHDPLLNDSKQMSERNRDRLRPIIEREAVAWAVAAVPPERIDEINILNASFEGMCRAVGELRTRPEFLAIDGNRFRSSLDIPYRCIVKGDGKYADIAAASVLASLLPPLLLARVIDRLTGGIPLTFAAALLYFGSLALEGVLTSAQETLLEILGQKMTHALRAEMSQKLTRLPAATLSAQNPGELAARFSGDVDTVEALFTSGIISMVADACRILSIMAVIAAKNPGLALILLLVLPLFAVFTRRVQRRMLAAQLDNRRAVAAVSGQVPETLHNIRTIRALGMEQYMERRYDRCIGAGYAAMERTNFYDAVYSPVVLLLNAVVVGIVMLLSASGNAVVLELFGMSVGTSVAVINYISRIFAPIESLGMEVQTIQSAMAGVKRIDAFLAQPEREISAQRTRAARGDVELSHVTFGYGEKHVLNDFSMTVKQGEQVTLIGRTGAGKSTVFKLLLGLYPAESGTVTIGGVPVAYITDRERRTCISCVEQHFARVPGTVLDQITLGDARITEEMAKNAARLAGIDAAIASLPEGYDTVCTDGMFSQGEWQLLSIARAAAAAPAVLLLDEITANLDAETEARVLEALRRASEGRTVLSVSHRVYENLGGRTIEIRPQPA